LEKVSMGYAIALLAAAGVVGGFEWRTDEDLVTLAVLVAASFALGFFRPRRFWISGIIVGLVVPALGLLTLVTGVRPVYETASQAAAHGANYVLSLILLALPALLLAWLGSLVGARARAAPNA
jgi:hypothetical protein